MNSKQFYEVKAILHFQYIHKINFQKDKVLTGSLNRKKYLFIVIVMNLIIHIMQYNLSHL